VVRKGTSLTAEPLWKNTEVSMYMSSPVIVDDMLVGLSHRNRGQFFALDVASGKTLWTTPGREGDNASIVAANHTLVLTTTGGELIVARASRDRFDAVKRYRIAESAVWAHPALSGTTILVKDVDRLICWSV
jgi:outer membrane protein assembly factor BamB